MPAFDGHSRGDDVELNDSEVLGVFGAISIYELCLVFNLAFAPIRIINSRWWSETLCAFKTPVSKLISQLYDFHEAAVVGPRRY